MSLFFFQHPTEADMALFAGGEAGPLSRWRIENHIDRCDSCREVVADFLHFQSDLEQLSEVPEIDWNTLSRDIEASVKQALIPVTVAIEPATKTSGSWLGRRPVWGFGFASAAVFCGLIIFQELSQDMTSKTPVFRDALKQQIGMQSGTRGEKTRTTQNHLIASDDGESGKRTVMEVEESVVQGANRLEIREPTHTLSVPFDGSEQAGLLQRDDEKFQRTRGAPTTDSNSNYGWDRVTTRDAEFSLIPDRLRYEGAEIGVAADGSMSIRTLDSLTNTVMITHVYLP